MGEGLSTAEIVQGQVGIYNVRIDSPQSLTIFTGGKWRLDRLGVLHDISERSSGPVGTAAVPRCVRIGRL